jgi:enterochelin esterase family protein
MRALTDKGYEVNYQWGIGRHSQKHGGAVLPDMLRWLWRDQPGVDGCEGRCRTRIP